MRGVTGDGVGDGGGVVEGSSTGVGGRVEEGEDRLEFDG